MSYKSCLFDVQAESWLFEQEQASIASAQLKDDLEQLAPRPWHLLNWLTIFKLRSEDLIVKLVHGRQPWILLHTKIELEILPRRQQRHDDDIFLVLPSHLFHVCAVEVDITVVERRFFPEDLHQFGSFLQLSIRAG